MRKTKIFFLPVLILVSIVVSILSCENDNQWKENEKREKTELDNYYNTLVQQYSSEAIETLKDEDIDQTGYFVRLYDDPTLTGQPTEDDYVVFDYHGTYLNGDIYQTTFEQFKSIWSNYNTYNYDHYNFSPVKISLAGKAPGLIAGLRMMNEGDSALLVMPSALFLNDFEHTPLVYSIKLRKVIPKNQIARTDSLILDYFLKYDTLFNNIASGIYYKETDTVRAGVYQDSVTIKYQGHFLQENDYKEPSMFMFESNLNGIKVPINNLTSFVPQGYLSFPKGFSFALDSLVRAGTKAEVYIDYTQGFGSAGLEHSIYSYIIVPPYTSMYYTIEIVK